MKSPYKVIENTSVPGTISLKRPFWELGDADGKGHGLLFGHDATFAEHVRDLLNLRNPFLDADGKETGTFQTGDRLEKIQTFTLQDCKDALALNQFCITLNCHFLNVTVEKSVLKRMKRLQP